MHRHPPRHQSASCASMIKQLYTDSQASCCKALARMRRKGVEPVCGLHLRRHRTRLQCCTQRAEEPPLPRKIVAACGQQQRPPTMLETAVASVPLLTLKRSGAHGGAHGIPAIRHHLKTVDDVPLLVSIFTDSTPSNVSDRVRNGDVRIFECLLPQMWRWNHHACSAMSRLCFVDVCPSTRC